MVRAKESNTIISSQFSFLNQTSENPIFPPCFLFSPLSIPVFYSLHLPSLFSLQPNTAIVFLDLDIGGSNGCGGLGVDDGAGIFWLRDGFNRIIWSDLDYKRTDLLLGLIWLSSWWDLLLLDCLWIYGFLLLLVVLGMFLDLCCWCCCFTDMKH